MKDVKRRELEERLRRLIDAADQKETEPEPVVPRMKGRNQVIRRRKGMPDRYIVESRHAADPVPVC